MGRKGVPKPGDIVYTEGSAIVTDAFVTHDRETGIQV